MELRTVILYRSRHHGNTKKLIDAIVERHPDIDLIDVAQLGKREYPDLSSYHIICLASGIYYNHLDKDLLRVAQECLRDGDNVIALMTYGGENKWYVKEIDGICRVKMATLVTAHGCPGFDTWGPFKLVGGVNKGRPNDEDVEAAVAWFDRLYNEYGQIFIDERKKRDARDRFNAAHPTGGLMADLKHTVNKMTGKVKKAPLRQAEAGQAPAGDQAAPTPEAPDAAGAADADAAARE